MQRMQAQGSLRTGTAVLTAACGIMAVFALGACMDGSSTAPDDSAVATVEGRAHPPTGSLAITVAVPKGVTPILVAVTGPARFTRLLTASQTLSGLPVGSYTITAISGIMPNAIVSTVEVPTITGSPAAVMTGATATASVAYGPQPGTGGLWALSSPACAPPPAPCTPQTAANQFLAAQLVPAGTPSVTFGGLGTAALAAFDARGNLWIENGTSIAEYPVAELAASSSPTPPTPPTPAVTISGSNTYLSQAGNFGGIAFDREGNLWVSGWVNGVGPGFLIEFTPAQLAVSGSPTPAVVLTAPGTVTAGNTYLVEGLAFDAGDNLWLATSNALFTSNSVMKITPAQRARTGPLTSSDILGLSVPSSDAAFTPAFDARGNLWVTIFPGTSLPGLVMEIPAAQLRTNRNVTAAVTLTFPINFVPWYLAFDNSGDAWVSDFNGSNGIWELTPAQLSTTATATPTVILGAGTEWSGLAFDPHAIDLPLAFVQ